MDRKRPLCSRKNVHSGLFFAILKKTGLLKNGQRDIMGIDRGG